LRDRISCVYFNARSIVNKADDLELLITLENPDIVGISETWLTQNISINEYNFQGYTLFRADRNDQFKTRGGGAALYIKNDLNPILREDITNENFPECVVCSVGAEGDRLIVGACYRPGDSQIFNDEGLCSMLGKLEGENFVIVGDFNFSELRC
jgi:exonuclease III